MSGHPKSRVIVVFLMAVISTSCGGEASVQLVTEMDRANASYLEGVLPACQPIVSSDSDPCRSDGATMVKSATASGGWPIWASTGVFPSYTEVLLGFGFPALTPHLIIRGVVLADSTRCDLYPLEHYGFEGDRIQWKNAYHYYCFSEVQVREYIIGEGPPVLSVIMHHEFLGLSQEKVDDWANSRADVVKGLDYPGDRTAAAYENRELVLFLSTAPSVSVESWDTLISSTSFWFVQKRGDEIRAVSVDAELADTAEERAALDMPLDDLVAKIKAAAVERKRLTGGRVGITAVDGAVAADGEGERFPAAQGVRAGATLPMLVTDGNKLQDYYVAAGAVYEGEGKTTVLPPSPPADFVPPSTTTSTTLPVSTSSTVEASTSTTATSSTTVAPSSTTTVPVPSTSTTSAPTSTTTTITEPSTTTTTSVPVTSTTTSTTVASTTTTVSTTTTSISTVPSTTSATTSTTVAGGVSISVSDASATEGEWLVFNVTLSEEPYRQVVVNYGVRDVTAESGVDYSSPAGTFLFGPFDVRKTVRVWIVDDSKTEETETFQLVISDPYGASIAKPVGTGTILDNDS